MTLGAFPPVDSSRRYSGASNRNNVHVDLFVVPLTGLPQRNTASTYLTMKSLRDKKCFTILYSTPHPHFSFLSFPSMLFADASITVANLLKLPARTPTTHLPRMFISHRSPENGVCSGIASRAASQFASQAYNAHGTSRVSS